MGGRLVGQVAGKILVRVVSQKPCGIETSYLVGTLVGVIDMQSYDVTLI